MKRLVLVLMTCGATSLTGCGGSDGPGAVDSGAVVDSALADSGTTDSGVVVDSGSADSGTTDSGAIVDSGTVDSGAVDSGTVTADSGIPSFPGCANPSWLAELIAMIESEPVTNPPSQIIEYTYMGSTVYYRPSRCCDIFSDLYDGCGTLICHPDGGITGMGDGRCPDFFTSATNVGVIWADPR